MRRPTITHSDVQRRRVVVAVTRSYALARPADAVPRTATCRNAAPSQAVSRGHEHCCDRGHQLDGAAWRAGGAGCSSGRRTPATATSSATPPRAPDLARRRRGDGQLRRTVRERAGRSALHGVVTHCSWSPAPRRSTGSPQHKAFIDAAVAAGVRHVALHLVRQRVGRGHVHAGPGPFRDGGVHPGQPARVPPSCATTSTSTSSSFLVGRRRRHPRPAGDGRLSARRAGDVAEVAVVVLNRPRRRTQGVTLRADGSEAMTMAEVAPGARRRDRTADQLLGGDPRRGVRVPGSTARPDGRSTPGSPPTPRWRPARRRSSPTTCRVSAGHPATSLRRLLAAGSAG